MLVPCKCKIGTSCIQCADRRTCHPGPCPPCQVALVVPCPSHHTGLTVKCAVASSNNAALTPVCDEICGKERNCGNIDHACEVSRVSIRRRSADSSNSATLVHALLVPRSRLSSAIVGRRPRRSSAGGTARRRSDVRRWTRPARRRAGLEGTAAGAAVPASTTAVSIPANR